MIDQNQHKETGEDTEMTLKDLLSGLSGHVAEVRRNWKLLVFICLPFLIWQGYNAYTTPVQYDAGLTFMVDEESSASAGMLGSLLGDIGLGGSESNYDKILELAKSQRIIRMALFSKVEIDGKMDYFANHIIRIQKVHEEEWYKKPDNPALPSLNGFLFTRDSFEQFNRLEYAAFKSLYGILMGDKDHKSLFRSKYNQDSGVMSLGLTTRSERLSIELLRTIFDHLSEYYITSSTQKEQITYDIIKSKTDSIYQLLTGSEIKEAQFQDQSFGLIKAADQVPGTRYARNKSMYAIMYGEALKNLEIADYALKDRTPYVEAIDLPVPPLSGYGYGKKKALALGLGLGLVVGIGFVVGRSLVRQNLQHNP